MDPDPPIDSLIMGVGIQLEALGGFRLKCARIGNPQPIDPQLLSELDRMLKQLWVARTRVAAQLGLKEAEAPSNVLLFAPRNKA